MGFFDKIQDSISSAAEQTKTKAQETQLKRERGKKLEALGAQAYALFQNGQLTQQELVPACQEVTELESRIAAAEQQFQAAKPQPAAPGVPGAPAQAPAPPQAAAAPPPPQAAPAAPPPPPAAPAGPPPPQPPSGEGAPEE